MGSNKRHLRLRRIHELSVQNPQPKSVDSRYFVSTQKSPIERHLYSVHLSGADMTALTDVDSDGYYQFSFSPKAQYYLISYRGPELPHQYVLSTHDPTFRLPLENNSPLNGSLSRLDLPKIEYGTIEVDGYSLNYKEIRPPNFDGSGTVKYPVLFAPYGGPLSQMAEKSFGITWEMFLASEPRLEYITVVLDNRGTGFIGRKARAGIRTQLGVLESYDQAAAAEYFLQHNPQSSHFSTT
jgi:dipeptidyl aminopeptidase B